MLEKLKHTFALSDQGAKDMVKAFFACILHNLSLMVPVVLLYNLISDLLDGGIPHGKSTFYIVGLAIALGLIMLTCYIQYNATFLPPMLRAVCAGCLLRRSCVKFLCHFLERGICLT